MDLRKQLITAWEFRLNQKNDLSYELFYKITHQQDKLKDVHFQISLLSLKASLLRWKTKNIEAKNCLDDISNTFSIIDIQKNYFYFLELGLQNFSSSSYMNSLDYFIKAKTLTEDERYKFIALFNIYVTSIKLEILSKHIFLELKNSFEKIKNFSGISGLANQYQHLKINMLWKEAKFSELKKIEKKEPDTQALYLQLYLSNIPYVDLKLDNISIDDICFIKNLHLSSYRIRTLSGRLHPDDFNVQDSAEIVDRLYLWFWKFLKNPKEFPINKLAEYLSNIQYFSKKVLTEEARCKLRNIYLALALITKSDFSSAINNFYFGFNKQNKILDLEKNIFLYLSSNSEYKKDILDEINASSIFNNKQLFFKQLFNKAPKKTDKLYLLGQELQQTMPQAPKICQYLVNKNNDTLFFFKNKESIVSKVFVDALFCLFEKKEVSCQSLFFAVCGISEYDNFIHSKRLWNILSKLQKVCSKDFSYKIRNNIIYIQADWSKFFLLKRGLYLEQIQDSQIINHLQNLINLDNTKKIESKITHIKNIKNIEQNTTQNLQAVRQQATNSLSEKDIEGFISRKDLEIILNTSRSSVGRALQLWSKQNMLVKKGHGKNTQYKLHKKIISNLIKD